MNDAEILLFISKAVFNWLIQILYKTISLLEGHSFAWPPLPLPLAKLPEYGRYVQNLLVMAAPSDVLDQYLRYCPNIINFWSDESLSQRQLERLICLPLRHLKLGDSYCLSSVIPQNAFTSTTTSLFSTITHLDIEELDIPFLSRFLSLTHLVLHEDVGPEVYGEVFRQHPRLKVLSICAGFAGEYPSRTWS
ncbi:hypothetical protein BDN72DRAFT_834157 [Pluteus cervinus]|uniref:Uncharacterized protein n=1 Tax=Pluteus cervinus TaxID=181527 RepID=A0ACD3B6V0_9AGAR|nr:hypothetical protein BDN72DRAFT_834157 [Pluteus cervinus]